MQTVCVCMYACMHAYCSSSRSCGNYCCCFTTALLQELKSKVATLEATQRKLQVELQELQEEKEEERQRASGGGGGAQHSASSSVHDEVKAGAGLLVYEAFSY